MLTGWRCHEQVSVDNGHLQVADKIYCLADKVKLVYMNNRQ